jgi:hypothetical protein
MPWTPILSTKKEWRPILSTREEEEVIAPPKPKGLVATKVVQAIKNTTPKNVIGGARIVGKAIMDAANRNAEEKRGMTLGEKAKKDATTALKVAAFFPRVILGGLSGAGKTVLEHAYTNPRPSKELQRQ